MRSRRSRQAERETEFDSDVALAAFDTPEVAIDPVPLAASLRECISAQPRIEIRTQRIVLSAREADDGIEIETDGPDGRSRDTFDQAITTRISKASPTGANMAGYLGINAVANASGKLVVDNVENDSPAATGPATAQCQHPGGLATSARIMDANETIDPKKLTKWF